MKNKCKNKFLSFVVAFKNSFPLSLSLLIAMRTFFKKLLYAFWVLLGVVSLLFFLFNVLPDDPARLTLGQRTDAASIENVRKQLHLDKPIGQRYFLFINDLMPVGIYKNQSEPYPFHQTTLFQVGENNVMLKTPYLGRSYQSKKPVWDMLTEALPGTVILALLAIIIGAVLGSLLGILAALKKDTFWDTSAILTSVLGISTPSFFAGLLIAYIFGYLFSNLTGLQMTGALWEYDIMGNKQLMLRNLILPAFTLGIRPMAVIAQLMRSSLLDVLSQDYIRTAKAKGLSMGKIIWRHALPNALNPVITAVSGWFAELLAGSFFIEFIFSWKGLGKLTVDALDKFDFPVVIGAIIFSASVFVVVNMLTDLVYKWIDPRIKEV